jgi:hypothetical protein
MRGRARTARDSPAAARNDPGSGRPPSRQGRGPATPETADRTQPSPRGPHLVGRHLRRLDRVVAAHGRDRRQTRRVLETHVGQPAVGVGGDGAVQLPVPRPRPVVWREFAPGQAGALVGSGSGFCQANLKSSRQLLPLLARTYVCIGWRGKRKDVRRPAGARKKPPNGPPRCEAAPRTLGTWRPSASCGYPNDFRANPPVAFTGRVAVTGRPCSSERAANYSSARKLMPARIAGVATAAAVAVAANRAAHRRRSRPVIVSSLSRSCSG